MAECLECKRLKRDMSELMFQDGLTNTLIEELGRKIKNLEEENKDIKHKWWDEIHNNRVKCEEMVDLAVKVAIADYKAGGDVHKAKEILEADNEGKGSV